MKKCISPWIIFVSAMILLLSSVPVFADMGPHHKVQVYFIGLPEEEVCVTLLSSTLTSGPYHAWNDVEGDESKMTPPQGQERAWERFYQYRDPEGYMFLQYSQMVTETTPFMWGYYSPRQFKILVYLPEADKLLTSDDIQRTYAIHSVYHVDLTGVSETISSVQTYSWGQEILAFVIRLVLTLAIEIGLAWFVGFRRRKQLVVIAVANVVTQIMLNLYMFVSSVPIRPLWFEVGSGIRSYLLIELLTTAVEAVAYLFLISGDEEHGKEAAVWYAVIANAASFFIGIALARIVPFAF